jgi:hypothetical protein
MTRRMREARREGLGFIVWEVEETARRRENGRL